MRPILVALISLWITLSSALAQPAMQDQSASLRLTVTDLTEKPVSVIELSGVQSISGILNLETGSSWASPKIDGNNLVFGALPGGTYVVNYWISDRGLTGDQYFTSSHRQPNRRDFRWIVSVPSGGETTLDIPLEGLPIHGLKTTHPEEPLPLAAEFYKANAAPICEGTSPSDVMGTAREVPYAVLGSIPETGTVLSQMVGSQGKAALVTMERSIRSRLSPAGVKLFERVNSTGDLASAIALIDEKFGIGRYCTDHPDYQDAEKECRQDLEIFGQFAGPVRRYLAAKNELPAFAEDYRKHADYVEKACGAFDREQNNLAVKPITEVMFFKQADHSNPDIGPIVEKLPLTIFVKTLDNTGNEVQYPRQIAVTSIRLSNVGDLDNTGVEFSLHQTSKAPVSSSTAGLGARPISGTGASCVPGGDCWSCGILHQQNISGVVHRMQTCRIQTFPVGADTEIELRLPADVMSTCNEEEGLELELTSLEEDDQPSDNIAIIDICDDISENLLKSISIVTGNGDDGKAALKPQDHVRVRLEYDVLGSADQQYVKVWAERPVKPEQDSDVPGTIQLQQVSLAASPTGDDNVLLTQEIPLARLAEGGLLQNSDIVRAQVASTDAAGETAERIIAGDEEDAVAIDFIDTNGNAVSELLYDTPYTVRVTLAAPAEAKQKLLAFNVESSAARDAEFRSYNGFIDAWPAQDAKILASRPIRFSAPSSIGTPFEMPKAPWGRTMPITPTAAVGDRITASYGGISRQAILTAGERKDDEARIIVRAKDMFGQAYATPVEISQTGGSYAELGVANRPVDVSAGEWTIATRYSLVHTQQITTEAGKDYEVSVPDIGMLAIDRSGRDPVSNITITRLGSSADGWSRQASIGSAQRSMLPPGSYVLQPPGAMSAAPVPFSIKAGQTTTVPLALARLAIRFDFDFFDEERKAGNQPFVSVKVRSDDPNRPVLYGSTKTGPWTFDIIPGDATISVTGSTGTYERKVTGLSHGDNRTITFSRSDNVFAGRD